tara:strand:+ start:597 stop:968 length:372 start_codon:yes stop_codon:yes gene_type:complete
MNNVPMLVRLLLGLVFVLFGLNGFFDFIPLEAPAGEAGAFLGALGASGYMLPLIKIVEIVAGALLLTNRHVTLATLMLAPIVVNILAFHIFLDNSGMVMAGVVSALEGYMLYENRNKLKQLLN